MTDLYQEWRAYHEEHPQVYQLVCRFAQEALDRGFHEYAIATIWERIRWHVTVEIRKEEFKLPNNHRAYYARLWLDDHPEHSDFFRTACLRSEGGSRDRFGRAA
jgi:hypothetical protein